MSANPWPGNRRRAIIEVALRRGHPIRKVSPKWHRYGEPEKREATPEDGRASRDNGFALDQHEIGRELEMSQQAVAKLIVRALKKARMAAEALGLREDDARG